MARRRGNTSLHCLFLETVPQLDLRDTQGTFVPPPCQDGWGPGPSPSEPACPNATKAEGQELPGRGYLEVSWISSLDPRLENTGLGMRPVRATVPALFHVGPGWAPEILWPLGLATESSGS